MISIVPVEGLPEIEEGDDLGALIAARAQLEDGDVVVVAQKAVSKAEGRVVRIEDVEASDAGPRAGGRARPARGRGRPARDGADRARAAAMADPLVRFVLSLA